MTFNAEIVTNVYLDHLVDTVLAKGHIPPIVLVVSAGSYTIASNILDISAFKILDGLQRTYRLKSIRDTIQLCVESVSDPDEYLAWNQFKLSRHFSARLRELNSSTNVLRAVLATRGSAWDGRDILSTYRDNAQWFEVWANLSPAEEVSKMLT